MEALKANRPKLSISAHFEHCLCGEVPYRPQQFTTNCVNECTVFSVSLCSKNGDQHTLPLIGKLLLSLDKDMYEQLGLQGNPSCYQKHRHGDDINCPMSYDMILCYVQWCRWI